MNIKNVLTNLKDELKKKDERVCTYLIDKSLQTEDSLVETLNFFVLRLVKGENPGEAPDDVLMFHLDFFPRLNGKKEFNLYLDGYKPLQFNKEHLGSVLKQCFPNVKKKRIETWEKVINEYCTEQFSEVLEIYNQAK